MVRCETTGKHLQDLIAENTDNESEFATMKGKVESDLKSIEDDDLKMNLFLKKRIAAYP